MKKLYFIFSLCIACTLLLASCGKECPDGSTAKTGGDSSAATEQANIEGYKKATNAFLAGDKETVAQLISPNAIDHNPDTFMTKKQGLEGMYEMMDHLKAMYSDMKFDISMIDAKGDMVYAFGKMSGKWTGDMGPMKANNKTFSVDFAEAVKVKD